MPRKDHIGGGTAAAAAALLPPALDAPTFDVPPDFYSDRPRYQLVSIRMPAGFDPSTLDGTELDLDETALFGGANGGGQATAAAAPLVRIEAGEEGGESAGALCLLAGHRSESEGFRLLVRSGKTKSKRKKKGTDDDDDSSDDDSDDDGQEGEAALDASKSLIPLARPFDAHLNVSDAKGSVHDAPKALDLAPGLDKAPAPSSSSVEAFREAYTSVPQRTGLRRRWVMPGAAGGAGTGAAATKTAAPITRVKEEGDEPREGKQGDAEGKSKKKKKKCGADEEDKDEPAESNGAATAKKEKKSAKKKSRKGKKRKTSE